MSLRNVKDVNFIIQRKLASENWRYKRRDVQALRKLL